jgi:hypothetical protein
VIGSALVPDNRDQIETSRHVTQKDMLMSNLPKQAIRPANQCCGSQNSEDHFFNDAYDGIKT